MEKEQLMHEVKTEVDLTAPLILTDKHDLLHAHLMTRGLIRQRIDSSSHLYVELEETVKANEYIYWRRSKLVCCQYSDIKVEMPDIEETSDASVV